MKMDLRQRTLAFALEIVRTFGLLPRQTDAQILGKQVLRAGTSTGANYCQDYRGRSKAEFISKCGDCLREAEETAYWLELLVASGVVPASQLATVRNECDQLIAIFVTILRRKETMKRRIFSSFLILTSSFSPFSLGKKGLVDPVRSGAKKPNPAAASGGNPVRKAINKLF